MAMSKKHKEAIVKGRKETTAVKAYLDVLGSRRPGRPVTTETLSTKLKTINDKIAAESDPIRRVSLYQARINAEDALAAASQAVDFDQIEAGFVENAAAFSERKGISYSAWREAGVSAVTLKSAGIARTRRG